MRNKLACSLALTLCLAGLSLAENAKSPKDHVSATVGGQTITIDYSRPSLRGRKAVGGQLVPLGQVWRTGADEATKLTTPVDLQIGTVKLPKGSYSLFTLPTSAEKWDLIVNKTANQWGAFEYKQADDLGRTALKITKPGAPVEKFTIELKSTGADAADLVLSWENTVATVPVKLAK